MTKPKCWSVSLLLYDDVNNKIQRNAPPPRTSTTSRLVYYVWSLRMEWSIRLHLLIMTRPAKWVIPGIRKFSQEKSPWDKQSFLWFHLYSSTPTPTGNILKLYQIRIRIVKDMRYLGLKLCPWLLVSVSIEPTEHRARELVFIMYASFF